MTKYQVEIELSDEQRDQLEKWRGYFNSDLDKMITPQGRVAAVVADQLAERYPRKRYVTVGDKLDGSRVLKYVGSTLVVVEKDGYEYTLPIYPNAEGARYFFLGTENFYLWSPSDAA